MEMTIEQSNIVINVKKDLMSKGGEKMNICQNCAANYSIGIFNVWNRGLMMLCEFCAGLA